MNYSKILEVFQITEEEVRSFENCLVITDKPSDPVSVIDGRFDKSKSRTDRSSRSK